MPFSCPLQVVLTYSSDVLFSWDIPRDNLFFFFKGTNSLHRLKINERDNIIFCLGKLHFFTWQYKHDYQEAA